MRYCYISMKKPTITQSFDPWELEGGDCTFAQIVHIRDKLARGKPLDKSERVWYRQNRRLVDFKTTYTDAEEQLLKDWA